MNNNLLEKFLNEDKENKELYFKAEANNDQYYIELVTEKFYNYVFKIYFISYIEKSLKCKALEIKKKRKKMSERELFILNVIDEDFNDEKVNMIRDDSIDFLEEMSKEMDFKGILENKELVKAIGNATRKQKLVLFMHYIEEKEEKQIDSELNISKQSVNKVKLAGLKRVRTYLGGEINGRTV